MKTLPEKIRIKFTEEDRMGAESYTDSTSCIVATALKRLGYNHEMTVNVGPVYVAINRQAYLPARGAALLPSELSENANMKRPFYDKSVVGRELTLRKETK